MSRGGSDPRPDRERINPIRSAESLYLRFAGDDPTDARLDALCQAHPEHAHSLRGLHDDFHRARRSLGQAAGSPDPSADQLAAVIERIDSVRGADSYDLATPLVPGRSTRGETRTRVEQVWDLRLRRPVARKTLSIDTRRHDLSPAEEASVRHFLGELRALALLQHPGIPTLHDAGVDQHGHLFFTMSRASGATLAAVIERVRAGDDRMWTRARALQVLVQACDAIGHAHAHGIAHGDLGPENILVGRLGEVVVVGWGGAAGLLSDGPTAASNRAADLRALGSNLALVAACTSGEAATSAELSAILARTAAAEPQARYGGVHELAHDLRACLERRVVQAYARGKLARLRAWARRNPGLAAAVGIAVVASVGSVTGILVVQGREQAALQQARDGLAAEQVLAARRLVNVEARAYANDLATVLAVLTQNRNVGQVRALLDRCKPELRGAEWRVLDVLADSSARTFVGPGPTTDGVLSLSPDGRWLAANGGDASSVWDTRTGERAMRVRTPAVLAGVAISHDGRLVAAAGGDWVVRLYEVASGRCLSESKLLTAGRVKAAFTPDNCLVTVGDDRRVRVWSTPSLTELRSFPSRVGNSPRLGIDAGGTRVAVVDWRGDLALLDLSTGTCILQAKAPGSGVPEFATADAELRLIGQDGILRRDLGRGTSVVVPLPDGVIGGCGLHLSDGSRMALAIRTSLAVFDTASMQRLGTWHGHTALVHGLAAERSGRWLYTIDGDGVVKQWDLEHPVERVLSGPQGEIADIACTGAGRFLAAATRKGTLWVWDLDGDSNPRSKALGLGPLAALRGEVAADRARFVVVPTTGPPHGVDVATLELSAVGATAANCEPTAQRRVTIADGTRVLELGEPRADEVRIRDASRFDEPLLTLALPAAGTSVMVDPSERVIAAALVDGRIAAWVLPVRP